MKDKGKMRVIYIVNESRANDLTKSNKESKITKLKKTVSDARDDERKEQFNNWAESLGYPKPNKLSYEV